MRNSVFFLIPFFLITCILVFAPGKTSAQAQYEFPEFGIFSQEEKKYTCQFEKDAEAVILLDHGVSNPGHNNELVTERTIRIKILNENGVRRADIKIPYYTQNDFE